MALFSLTLRVLHAALAFCCLNPAAGRGKKEKNGATQHGI